MERETQARQREAETGQGSKNLDMRQVKNIQEW